MSAALDRLPVLAVALSVLLGALAAVALQAGAAAERRGARDAALADLGSAWERRAAELESRAGTVFAAVEERSLRRGLERAAALHAVLKAEPFGLRLDDLLPAGAPDRGAALARELFDEDRLRAKRLLASLGPEEVPAGGPARVLRWTVPSAALLASALLSVLWMRSRVARPLADLATTMDAVAGGAVRRVREDGAPEVRALRGAFNRMADALDGVRKDLEARVDAKTAALGAALEEQRALNERLQLVLDELKVAQDRLVRQERLAAVGTLAGGVAHEFNNLLGGIRGCAEQALDDATDPGQRQSLEVITRAAARGRTIVDGLLRFSRGASRAPRVLDLGTAVREACDLLRPAAAERGVTIGDGPLSGISVSADPVELHQVLVNLVLNAIQASPAGAAVEVAAGGGTGPDTAAIEVRDRGPGIAPAIAARIFEPFFTTREREGGTGLGLAITHGIVQGLGGVLSFAPRADGGTVFRVELPRAAHDPPART